MVRIGDTVLVTIPTYRVGFGGFGGTSGLQSTLQQAGFRVVGIDDSAIPWLGTIGGRGNLLVSVIPTTSDYGSAQDVASIVAGAAYANNYDIDAGAQGVVIARATQVTTPIGTSEYEQLQRNLNVNPIDNPLELPFGLSANMLLLIGAAVAVVLVLKK